MKKSIFYLLIFFAFLYSCNESRIEKNQLSLKNSENNQEKKPAVVHFSPLNTNNPGSGANAGQTNTKTG